MNIVVRSSGIMFGVFKSYVVGHLFPALLVYSV